MPSVQKMVKPMFKILHHLLQDFEHVFDHFVDTRYYRVKQKTYERVRCSQKIYDRARF